MKEITLAKLVNGLSIKESQTLCLFSPNYEPRSMLGAQEFLSAVVPSDLLKFGILTIRGDSGRVEPLEALKSASVDTIQKIISEKFNRRAEYKEISYPQNFRNEEVRNSLTEFTTQLTRPFSLILDVSSLPRRVLISLIGAITRYSSSKELDGICFLYSWPERYPRLKHPTDLGTLKLAKITTDLDLAVKENSKVWAAVMLGHQGFEAMQFIETLHGNKNVDIYVFISRNDPFHSLEILRTNASIITDPNLRRHYYLSLEAGHEKLMQWAENCAKVEESGAAFLIAPFGPKLQVVSACLAMNKITYQTRGHPLCDIVVLSGHQYSTTYSLGYKGLSVFELDTTELEISDENEYGR